MPAAALMAAAATGSQGRTLTRRVAPALRPGPHDGTLPAPARAARPRLHDAAQPRPDGLDAHRASRTAREHFPRLAAYFAERARGGVGPDRHRRLRAQRRGLAAAVRRRGSRPARAARAAPADHRRRARRGRQDRAADPARRPLRLPPARRSRRRASSRPITPFTPRALSPRGVERQIRAFVRCAALAREAGYDGVEVMGSEGYFINQFLAARTNQRTDEWGGSYANRMRLPVEIVRAHARGGRAATSSSSTASRCWTWSRTARRWDEVVQLAKALEQRRRDDHQHRHRLARGARPDDRDLGAARRLRLGDARS